MTSIRINIGGTGGAYGNYSPFPQMDGALFAAYLFGSAYHGPGRFPGTSITDLSGKGRHATMAGGPLADNFMPVSPTSFFQLPFSTADVAAAHGEATLIAVAASDETSSFQEVGGLNVSAQGATKSIGLFAAHTGGGSPFLTLSSFIYQGAGQINIETTVPRSASVFEFHAATFSPGYSLPGGFNTLYRNRADFAQPEIQSGASGAALNDTALLRIGRTVDESAFQGTGKIAAVFAYNRKLSLEQIDDVYSAIRDLLASPDFGVAI